MNRYSFNLEVVNDSIKFSNDLTSLVESYVMHSELNRAIINSILLNVVFDSMRNSFIDQLVNEKFGEDGLSK